MLLRSSSTPRVGTLRSPFPNGPIRDLDGINNSYAKYPPLCDYHTTRLPFSHGLQHPKLTSFSCCSSPVCRCASQFSECNQEPSSCRSKAFRRASSDGNLEGLGYNSSDIDEFPNPRTPRKSLYKHNKLMLRTSPSFSIFNTSDEFQDEESTLQDPSKEGLERTVTIGESITAEDGGEFSFREKSMSLIEEGKEEEEAANEPISPPMYLATGLGIDSFGAAFGGGFDAVDLSVPNFDGSGDVEEYYKRMVDEYPCYPLFLRNYAQVLQSKGDLQGAEEYYSRATLAEPDDGEILLQFAKFVWEHHHDQDRASSYFERAAQVAPHDSHILGAYASFLWEIEHDKEEDEAHREPIQIEEQEQMKQLKISASKEESELLMPSLHNMTGLRTDMADVTAVESSRGGNVEEYHKKMVEENPNNPLFLRNYAQFLCQSKGDLQTAEEVYMRAILADPGDGEIMSLYAKLVWELHHDKDKALCNFERAVQAAPGDCHVLAAYASFLWETEDEEEGDDCTQMPLLQEQATNAEMHKPNTACETCGQN